MHPSPENTKAIIKNSEARSTFHPSIRNFRSQSFNLPSLGFAVETLALGTASCFAGFAPFRYDDRTFNQFLQPSQSLFPVLFLAAVFLRLDDNHTFGGDALVVDFQQTLLVAIGQ